MCLLSTVTVSSVPMRTKAFGANGEAPAAGGKAWAGTDWARAVPPGKCSASTRPAARLSMARRERACRGRVISVMGSALRRAGRVLDGGADADVGGTAAQVAVHREV